MALIIFTAAIPVNGVSKIPDRGNSFVHSGGIFPGHEIKRGKCSAAPRGSVANNFRRDSRVQGK
jgi:hypothetical protein